MNPWRISPIMQTKLLIYSLGIAFIAIGPVQAQSASPSSAANSVPVTADNFNRAESDLVMGPIVKDGGFGKYVHHRELYPVDAPIVRPNRDTLYSFSIFDLDAGPVTITLPNAGQRFLSLQVIDGEQFTPEVHYGAGRYTFTRETIGTRYVQLGVRILVDPKDPEDMKKVHALQDAIMVEQPGGPGRSPTQSACSAPGIRSIPCDT
jgi:Protein of unknown function (DUF1254)